MFLDKPQSNLLLNILYTPAFFISDQYCHHSSDNYILSPRNVGPKNNGGVFSIRPLVSKCFDSIENL